MEENKTPAGSEPINPMALDNQEQEPESVVEKAPAPKEDKPEPKKDDTTARLEKMLKDSQSMIGRQGNELGALKAQLEAMNRPAAGPSEDQQLADLYKQMDTGEIDIAEGMRQALAINSNLTASKVMNQLAQQQQQQEVSKIQGKFLKDNPDYTELLQNGTLDSYMEEDPLSDAYTAYQKYKADEKIKTLQAEYDQKVAAAKEEGAKLAKGAESAGKVLGKQGGSAQAPQVNRPFKNGQEMRSAMMEELQRLRSTSQ